MNHIKIFKFIENECKNKKVKFVTSDRESIQYPNGNMQVSGYFCSNKREMGVAVGKSPKEFIPVLIHEYCHMMQWWDRHPEWYKSTSSSEILDSWLEGEEYPDKLLDEAFSNLIKLESDCEQKTIEFMRNNHYPINLKEYAQQANSYILFYPYVRKYRKWYPSDKKPYNIKELWTKFPTEIVSSTSIFRVYENLYKEYLFSTQVSGIS